MDKKIFKTYEVRGVYGKELDEDGARKIGRAFVYFLSKEKPVIVIGRDGRKSSPSIFYQVKKGVTEAGGKVVDIGLCNTPLLNFAVAKFGYDGGLMVTASHNPPEFNGIKMIKERALQLYGEEIQQIRKIAEEKEIMGKEKGEVEKVNPLPSYINHLFSFFKEKSPLKMVLDFGNGVSSFTAKPFFERRGDDVFYLYDEIRGDFPGHPPDPHDKEAHKKIKSKILSKAADIGVIFDGDGDRCVIFDEKGEVVFGDALFMLLAKEEIKKKKKGSVCYDLRFSMATEEVIRKMGGTSVMMRVGNPFYKEKIIREGGLLGGELSGHIMFKDNYGIDDGLFAFLKVVEIASREKKPLSELITPYKKYFQTPEINFSVEDKEEAIQKVRNSFKGGEELHIDGLYIKYEDWWFSLRASNTEDLVRLRIEAKTEDLLEEKREEITSLLESL